MKIRALQLADWPRVREICRHGIATGQATFKTEAPDRKSWNSKHVHLGRLERRPSHGTPELTGGKELRAL